MASSSGSGKTMSSRLLTMKFMQRAAASAPSSANSSAQNTSDRRPSKRPRHSNGTSSSNVASSADMKAVKDALAAEEAKRVEAIERQAAEAGETRWVLSFQDPSAGRNDSQAAGSLNVVTGGFADVDASDDEPTGRMNFGKRSANNEGDPPSSSDDSQSEDEEEEVDYENDPVASLIREEKTKLSEQARQKLQDRRRKREQRMSSLGDERRKNQVNLNESDLPRPKKKRRQKGERREKGGSSSKGPMSYPDRPTTKCDKCGKFGHFHKFCPDIVDKRWSKDKQEWELEY